jgi:RsiW-degrading membrane proteinase PrsW (M82 family)
VGATASTLLASLLNAILFVVFDLAWISFPGADTLLPLIDGVVIAPLVEELAKPLVLLSLLQRVESARDALLLGMLAGTGFAALENLLYAAAAGPIWGGVLAVRAMNAALHPFGAGLMAVAWWRVLRREPGASGLWMRNYGLAVGVHALHNGICFAGGGGDWFEGWWVLLLALLLAEGIVLPLPLRALARRLALEAEGRPAAALPTERALAAWGLACLVVLLPVGLGIWQMVR